MCGLSRSHRSWVVERGLSTPRKSKPTELTWSHVLFQGWSSCWRKPEGAFTAALKKKKKKNTTGTYEQQRHSRIIISGHLSLPVIMTQTGPVWPVQFCPVQSLSHVWLFATPWTAARQASLSITNSWSLPKLVSMESVMPSSHLILCRPLLLLPSVFPSIRSLTRRSTDNRSWVTPRYPSAPQWMHTFLFISWTTVAFDSCSKLAPLQLNVCIYQFNNQQMF